MAEKELGDRIGDKDAYEWLRENGPDEYTLPPYENWARYLHRQDSVTGTKSIGLEKAEPAAA